MDTPSPRLSRMHPSRSAPLSPLQLFSACRAAYNSPSMGSSLRWSRPPPPATPYKPADSPPPAKRMRPLGAAEDRQNKTVPLAIASSTASASSYSSSSTMGHPDASPRESPASPRLRSFLQQLISPLVQAL